MAHQLLVIIDRVLMEATGYDESRDDRQASNEAMRVKQRALKALSHSILRVRHWLQGQLTTQQHTILI